jgi:predicted nucleic acid-binding protein
MDLLVDSSVWFEYFKRKEPYFSKVQSLLNTLSIIVIDPVIGELLQGALNKNEMIFIKEHIRYVPKIEIKDLFEKAGAYSFENKLVSRGIGLIDSCLIIATIETNARLWTMDKKIVNFLNEKYLFS